MESQKKRNWLVWNLANIVSSLRFFVPVFLFLTGWSVETKILLFVILLTTDALDGIIARWIGNNGEIGKFIDVSADKVMNISGLVFLLKEGLLEYWIVLPVMAGEMIVSALVLYGIYSTTQEISKGLKSQKGRTIETYREIRRQIIENIDVSDFGKLKSVCYFVGAAFVLINVFWPTKLYYYAYIVFFCTGLGFYAMSLGIYYKQARKFFSGE